MTATEFGEFLKVFASRFPFYTLSDERAKKLKAIFYDFSAKAALAGLEAYDLAFPDMNGQTFKLAGLLHHCCESAQQHQQDFKWRPEDESQMASFFADLRRINYPRSVSFRDFVMGILGKSRLPSEDERRHAIEALKKMNARTPADIEAIQQRNSDAYAKFRAMHPADCDELQRRNKLRAAQQKAERTEGGEPEKLSYVQRGRRLVEQMEQP
jgi:hypothetical protein